MDILSDDDVVLVCERMTDYDLLSFVQTNREYRNLCLPLLHRRLEVTEDPTLIIKARYPQYIRSFWDRIMNQLIQSSMALSEVEHEYYQHIITQPAFGRHPSTVSRLQERMKRLQTNVEYYVHLIITLLLDLIQTNFALAEKLYQSVRNIQVQKYLIKGLLQNYQMQPLIINLIANTNGAYNSVDEFILARVPYTILNQVIPNSTEARLLGAFINGEPVELNAPVEPEFIEYLKHTLTPAEMSRVVQANRHFFENVYPEEWEFYNSQY